MNLLQKIKNWWGNSFSQDEDERYLNWPEEASLSGIPNKKGWRTLCVPRVDDYTEPCFVYEDGTESPTYSSRRGGVIGYRISPTLVIHNMVGSGGGWFLENLVAFKKKYGGELLNMEEVAVLRKNFYTINQMRKLAGDSALPSGYFWADGKYETESVHTQTDETFYDPDTSNIILKRILKD